MVYRISNAFLTKDGEKVMAVSSAMAFFLRMRLFGVRLRNFDVVLNLTLPNNPWYLTDPVSFETTLASRFGIMVRELQSSLLEMFIGSDERATSERCPTVILTGVAPSDVVCM